MKILQTSRKLFFVLGADLYHTIQIYHWNIKSSIAFFIFFELNFCSGVCVLYISKSFLEYTESLYVFSVSVICINILSNII